MRFGRSGDRPSLLAASRKTHRHTELGASRSTDQLTRSAQLGFHFLRGDCRARLTGSGSMLETGRGYGFKKPIQRHRARAVTPSGQCESDLFVLLPINDPAAQKISLEAGLEVVSGRVWKDRLQKPGLHGRICRPAALNQSADLVRCGIAITVGNSIPYPANGNVVRRAAMGPAGRVGTIADVFRAHDSMRSEQSSARRPAFRC